MTTLFTTDLRDLCPVPIGYEKCLGDFVEQTLHLRRQRRTHRLNFHVKPKLSIRPRNGF